MPNISNDALGAENARVKHFGQRLLRSSYSRVLISALLALLAYGAWAYWVNRDHGETMASRAAMTQGGYSFLLTLCLTLMIEWLFGMTRHWRYQQWLLSIFTCLCLYASSYTVNAWAGTPEIFATILPSALMSTLYTVSYIYSLKKLSL